MSKVTVTKGDDVVLKGASDLKAAFIAGNTFSTCEAREMHAGLLDGVTGTAGTDGDTVTGLFEFNGNRDGGVPFTQLLPIECVDSSTPPEA